MKIVSENGILFLLMQILLNFYSLAHKSENVYNLSDILIRDQDVRTYFTGPHGRGKILHFAGSGHRSCGEATCYPEILRISYNFV